MQLETERLVLRRWQDADRAVLCEINQDPRVMEFFDKQATPPETNAFIDRIEAHFDRHGFGLFAVEHRDDGCLIGFIGLNIPRFEAHFTPCVEIGWRLSAEYWGMGLATEGARETLRFGFEDVGLDEIVAFTSSRPNRRSIRVMEKLGMVHDPEGGFDHPRIPAGHPLRPQVLYRIRG